MAIWENTDFPSRSTVFPGPQKNENPLSGCFDTLVSLSYLACPNKTLTPVMGLPLGMGCLFRRFTQSHPIAALYATLCCFVKMLQYVLMLSTKCVYINVFVYNSFVTERERGREKPNDAMNCFT